MNSNFHLIQNKQEVKDLWHIWSICQLWYDLSDLSDLSESPKWSDSQICEAVGGRARPLTRKSCDLSESPIGLSRTPAESPILGAVWLFSRLNALLRPESNRPVCVRGRSESPKWEAVWEADRPLTHTGRCCLSRGRLTDFTAKRIASPARVRSDSHGLTDLRGRVRERPCSLLIGSDRSHDKLCEAEAMWGRVRPNLWGHVRPCEAVWGRAPLIGLWDLPEPIRGARPHTASQIRPHMASHGLGLTNFPENVSKSNFRQQ